MYCLLTIINVFESTLKLVVPVSDHKINIEKNKKIDPNSVYIKNKKEALIRRSLEPQIPIIKNIGIKILSKKIKNNNKSIVEKDKIKKNSTKSKLKQ
jgi:hypothetical protein